MNYVKSNPPKLMCVTGDFIVLDEIGTGWVIGRQDLCGRDMHFAPVQSVDKLQ